MGTLQKIKKYISYITVEPIVIFFYLGNAMALPLSQEIFKWKVCHLQFKLPIDLCQNNSALFYYSTTVTNNSNFMSEIYKETSKWVLYHNLINTFPAMLITIFMGSWSDRFGRKIPMLIPVFGTVISIIVVLISVLYIELPLVTLLLNGFPLAITGGLATLMMSLFSYMADVTDTKTRTFRIAIVDICLVISATLSFLIGGQFVDKVGYAGTFIFILSLDVFVIIYIVLRIENKPTAIISPREQKCSFLNLITLNNLKEAIRTGFKKRKYNNRIHIWLLIFTIFLYSITRSGEIDIFVLFGGAPPIKWTFKECTYFLFFMGMSAGIGMLISIPIFKNVLKLQDTTVGIIGSLSKFVGCLVLSFSTQTWMIYFSGAIAIISSAPAIASRAYISKLINKDEQGKIFSLVSAAEALTPLLATVIYNTVLAYTLSIIPSICFIISSAIGAICATIYIGVYLTTSKEQKNEIENWDETEHEKYYSNSTIDDSLKDLK